MLRRVGGEIIEVFGLTTDDVLHSRQTLLVTGRFAEGGMFRSLYLAEQSRTTWRLAALGSRQLELTFPDGWPGPAELAWIDREGETRSESWPALPPWEPLVEAIEEALGQGTDTRIRTVPIPEAAPPAESRETSWTQPVPRLGWTDAIRALELDDAVRRSLHYHRSYTLDLQEASEETNFKGTMTLVGCGLLWVTIVLLFLSVWMPRLGWVIFPAIALFLGLQLFRWIVPKKRGEGETGAD